MTIGKRIGVLLALPVLLWSGTALGQVTYPPPATPANTPQKVEGQVTKIDQSQGRVTIRAKDGTVHEFQASQETLRDLKVGETIEAQLRPR
jgi:hypothetical protein